MIITITSCGDCPACVMNDICGGYSCKIKPNSEIIKDSKILQPKTPLWCPLKTNDVILKMTK